MGGYTDLMDDRGDQVLQRGGPLLRCRRLPEHALHPVQQRPDLTGLGQEISDAQRHGVAYHPVRAESGSDDHLGQLSLGLRLAQQGKAVHPR